MSMTGKSDIRNDHRSPVKLKTFSDLASLNPGDGPPESPKAPSGHDGRGAAVRLVLDRKGRKGKTVTLVTGIRHNPDVLKAIAKQLKEYCGTGGTVKEGIIELQGDQLERAGEKLARMNYTVR